MENRLFRKKSVERISSPEQLNEYLHVTSPSLWLFLIAVILLLLGIVIWSLHASIESFVSGDAVVDSNVVTVTLPDTQYTDNIEVGMNIKIGEHQTPITFLGRDQEGHLLAGGSTEMPDGNYQAKIGYKRTQILKMLFN